MDKMNMRVLFLSASISRLAGGVFYSIRSLAVLLSKKISIFVYGGKDSFSSIDNSDFESASIQTFKVLGPRAFGWQVGLYRMAQISKPDIVHLHGLWMFPSVVSLRCSKSSKIVISPHGMLDSWALQNSNWKKTLVAYLYERKNLYSAHCLHALCYEEYLSIRRYGLTNPVAIIPNGVSIPDLNSNVPPPDWAVRLPLNSKVLFYIGRLHPKKGLSNLLSAWNRFKISNYDESSIWHLVIAGWGQDDYVSDLESMVARFACSSSVHFVGPLFSDQKDLSFRRADAFILPSLSEGLPMSILEAWSYALPVLMTKECNLNEGFLVNAALEIQSEEESVLRGLEKLVSLDRAQLLSMGSAGRELVEEKFTQEIVANHFLQLYQWLLNCQNRPNFVRLD